MGFISCQAISPADTLQILVREPHGSPRYRQANNIKMSRKELVCDDAGKYAETLSWITASYFALHDAGSKPSLPVDSE